MKNLRRKLLPKNKSEWIILLGFLTYFITDLAHGRYKFDLENLTTKVALIEWMLRALRDFGLTIAIATMIIAGLRLIRKEGFTFKRLILPALGICIAGGCFLISYQGYQTFIKLPALSGTTVETRNKMEANIKSGTLSQENKAKRSKMYAYIRFQEDGVQINYFSPDGKEEQYKPTEKEKKEREDILKAQQLINWMTRSLYLSFYFWIVVIAVSLTAGLLTPVKKEHPTPG
ncbi:hypothetical protein [Geomonas ferrireducens]|uniref:hypothetical protein n=1 Tax=Geomonas ferrireducens TaxID=2570227 RepID=UPI0010A8D744|nr:hypothetical protein [Geomonas ferrireducens]